MSERGAHALPTATTAARGTAETGSADTGPAVRTARAKLTTHLRIVDTRADGYHVLDAEMVTLALADTLTFTDIDGSAESRLSVSGPWAPGVPTDGRNLVRRALERVGRRADVNLVKNIPAGGGLGGGSADAAAALAWAGCSDLALAASLGADVPFCLSGLARAAVGGIGELLDERPFEARDYTLVLLPFGVDTAAVYRAWDDLDASRREGSRERNNQRNGLEAAAVMVDPRLVTWRDRIAAAAGTAPTLAGSGSTWFLEGVHPDLGPCLPGATVVVTRTDRP